MLKLKKMVKGTEWVFFYGLALAWGGSLGFPTTIYFGVHAEGADKVLWTLLGLLSGVAIMCGVFQLYAWGVVQRNSHRARR